MKYIAFRSCLKIFIVSVSFLSCDRSELVRPEDSRFEKKVLLENLDEPMQFEILKDDKILFVERKGKIKVFDPKENKTKIIADIPVSIGYYSENGEELAPTGEDGMYGAVLDPNFENNGWIYVFYSPAGGEHRSLVSRFDWIGDSVKMDSEKVLLQIPNQRISCCHLGGGLLFDSKGNLYISTGDNTPNDPRGYNPIDNRPEYARFDAQRTSGNANDFRGKILRIRPTDDGSYSIPEGNLFPIGTEGTKPEIYTMGNRNPWRLSIDSQTGWLFWGEVGPAGVVDSVGFGPRSYDEFNLAKGPGNFGWPHFVGNNKPYWNYDYATNTVGEQFDPLSPINVSPHNTGIENLPPAVPALIWYPQTKSHEFPLMGSGSNSAVGGPVFRIADFDNPSRPFPAYYEGKWFITDWTRGWIMVVSLDEHGNFLSMEHFLPHLKLNGPIDIKFGPNGDLYVLEYGRGPYKLNPEASLSRIEYNSGNRRPLVKIASDKLAGAEPLTLNLTSDGTIDLDNDPLKYQWTISLDNETVHYSAQPNLSITLEKPGKYLISLKVTDTQGAETIEQMDVLVGNEPPSVKIDFNGRNSSFYFDSDTIHYAVVIEDSEDGSNDDVEFDANRQSLNIEFTGAELEGFDELVQAIKKLDAAVSFESIVANNIISSSDCKSCHIDDTKLIGPSYKQIAERYTSKDRAYLVNKILKGGLGVWDSKMAMPAHPDINEVQAGLIVDYILGLKDSSPPRFETPNGSFIVDFSHNNRLIKNGLLGNPNARKFIFRASYLDKGAPKAPELLGTDVLVLRNPIVPVINFNLFNELEFNHQITIHRSSIIPQRSGSFIALTNADLTEIHKLKLDLSILPDAKGTDFGIIEFRLGSSQGRFIGDLKLNDLPKGALKNKPVIDLVAVEGRHDLYVVFKNTSEKSDITAIELRSVEFIK